MKATGFFEKWRARARELKNDTYAVYLAIKDPRIPWYTKAFLICIAGYALSPIDLIPDFIPVIGYLDDLVLIPLGIALAIRILPPEVLNECRAEARRVFSVHRPTSRIAAAIIITIWGLLIVLMVVWAIRIIRGT